MEDQKLRMEWMTPGLSRLGKDNYRGQPPPCVSFGSGNEQHCGQGLNATSEDERDTGCTTGTAAESCGLGNEQTGCQAGGIG